MRKETFRKVDVDAILKDPEVVKEVIRECWRDGDFEGTLKYLKLLAKEMGSDDETFPQTEPEEYRTLHLLQEAGGHLAF